MGLLSETQQRHKNFHAEIARRAALVPQKLDRSYSIPNVPFGVAKMPPVYPAHPIDRAWWSSMWFHQLVEFQPRLPHISIKQIQMAVCAEFGIKLIDMLSQRRPDKIVKPRQAAIFLCKKLTTRSLPELGRRFGGRDHTTILHAVRKLEKDVQADPALRSRLAAIAASLGGQL